MMPHQASSDASALLGGPCTATGRNQATRWNETNERLVDVSMGLEDT